MRALTLVTGLFAALLLAGCAATPDKESGALPDWVLNPPQQPGYLYGVGSAPIDSGGLSVAEPMARREALLSITQQISVRTSSSEIASVSRTRSTNAPDQLVRAIERVVRQQVAEVELHHLDVVERHRTPDNSRLYLLLRLDMEAERGDLRRRISHLDLELESYRREVAQVSADVAGLRRLAPALRLVQERQALQQQLNRLDPAMAKPALGADLLSLRNAIFERMAQLTVTIEGPEDSGAVKAAIAARLQRLGLTVVEHGGALSVRYDIDVRQVVKDEVTFCFAEGSALLSSADGTRLYGEPVAIKRGATDAELARQRALDAMADELAEALINALLNEQ